MKSRFLFTALLSLILTTGWGQQFTKSFSWYGLSLSYPDNYSITEDEYDPDEEMYSICCEISDEMVVSLVQIYYNQFPFLSEATTDEIQEACEAGLTEVIETFKQAYSSLQYSKSTHNTSVSYPNASCTFSGSLMGIMLKGTCSIFIKDNYIVSCITQADNDLHLKEIEAIAKTISIK